MYALLPTMKGANADLLNSAINEMIQYYKDDNERLARELRWMGIVLRRADTIVLNEKRIVQERLNMYDDLMERDPKMRKIFADKEAQGEAKGETKGLQEGFVDIVETLFPDLADLARQRVAGITEKSTLRLLLKGVAAASDEAEAKRLLDVVA
jgi:isopentenyl diphosphate isomerase/L-lactate dehydrogenase-like FMN-dependent dehydrogenase